MAFAVKYEKNTEQIIAVCKKEELNNLNSTQQFFKAKETCILSLKIFKTILC